MIVVHQVYNYHYNTHSQGVSSTVYGAYPLWRGVIWLLYTHSPIFGAILHIIMHPLSPHPPSNDWKQLWLFIHPSKKWEKKRTRGTSIILHFFKQKAEVRETDRQLDKRVLHGQKLIACEMVPTCSREKSWDMAHGYAVSSEFLILN